MSYIDPDKRGGYLPWMITGPKFVDRIPIPLFLCCGAKVKIRQVHVAASQDMTVSTFRPAGKTTYTLKNIQQGSPDVTLFQVPANYTIDKIVPRVVKAPAQ
jgi:hypothetical protein